MKRIRHIYTIVIVFIFLVTACFVILMQYSSASLEASMAEVVTIQMEHSGSLLDQKIREIEIEAAGILNSDKLKTIQRCVTENKDVYDYILAANDLKEYLTGRQRSNVGMAEFKLYWPYSHRVVSNAMVGSIDSKVIELFADNE